MSLLKIQSWRISSRLLLSAVDWPYILKLQNNNIDVLMHLIFCNNWVLSFKIWATSSIFSQLDILPSSCNSRSCLMVITPTVTAGFTSGLPSLTSWAVICWIVCSWNIVPLCNIWVIRNELNPVCNKDLEPFTWIADITKYYLWVSPEILLTDFNIQLLS